MPFRSIAGPERQVTKGEAETQRASWETDLVVGGREGVGLRLVPYVVSMQGE